MVFKNIIKFIYFIKKNCYFIWYFNENTFILTENPHNILEEFDMGPTRTFIT